MSKRLPLVRWLSAARIDRRAPQDDPADMGTAFGLEMSLAEPAAPDAAAAPAAPARTRWLRRAFPGRAAPRTV